MISLSKITVRDADLNDRKAVWAWRQDCIHYGVIEPGDLTWDDFRTWFDGLLASDRYRLFIGTVETLRVGAVLYVCRKQGKWEECVLLKPFYLGKGLGEALVSASRERLQARVRSSAPVKFVKEIG